MHILNIYLRRKSDYFDSLLSFCCTSGQ